MDTAAYLRRIGIERDLGRPTVAALHELHRAHVERVPYETIEIHLQRPTTVDPHESTARVLRNGRGGYCYHLNNAFSVLLGALGYDARWHKAGVQTASEAAPPGATGSHLALTVHGLPSDENPDGGWLVDVGLGDALHEPLPVRPGVYRQGPFTYALAHSDVEPGGWRFEHDPRMSFVGMDLQPGRATQDDFRAKHELLSTSPESTFARTFGVQRRDADGVDVLTGCVFKRLPENGSPRVTVDTPAEWVELLHDVYGIHLPEPDRTRLWRRVRALHEEWLETAQ
jgi:N-hydroxyarylamine O-acetyltransferase